MEREEGGLSVEQVVRATLGRRRLFLASLGAGALVLGAAAAAIPPSYKATVVMTIEPGRYPNDFLRPNVIPGLDLRLGGMERMLESAPVIEELRVRTGLAAHDAPGGALQALGLASDPIEGWRKAFKFEIPLDVAQAPSHKADEAPLVEMSFKHADPEMAARVVNECAKRANEENNRFRRAFVEEVVRFIQKAQERATVSSRQRDEAFNSFKLANADRLPEQEAFISAKLGQLRIRYTDLKNTERFTEARLEQLISERNLLLAQIALNVQLLRAAGLDGDDRSTPIELRREKQRLQQELDRREDSLTELQEGFTPVEPRVRALKQLIERSKERISDIDKKLLTLSLGGELSPLRSGTAAVGSGALSVPDAFVPKHDRNLFPDDYDPYKAKNQKVPNAPLTDRLRNAAEPPTKEAPGPEAAAPAKNGKVAELLSIENVDEKRLQESLDEISYRLVVANPGYGRIRQIDFAAKETRDSQKELARQREEAFADIRKAEYQLAAIPEVRQRLESLIRELIEAREDYRRLSDQLDNARKALEVENEGKGEQFRVIDFARPPTKPSGPGRPIFMAVAMILAIGLAAGTCVVADMRAHGAFAGLASPRTPSQRAVLRQNPGRA